MKKEKMNILIVNTVVFVFIFSCFSPAFALKDNTLVTQGDGDIQSWAIIAGWGANPHQIVCVDHEIRMLLRILHRYGWNDTHIHVLQNEEAKKKAVLSSFEWLQDMNVDEDDIVFVFLSFHGSHKVDTEPYDEPDQMDGFLVTFDFEFEIEQNGILDDELGDALDSIVSQNVVVIVESCHSGEMIDGYADLCGDGRVILTGSTADELSFFLYRRMIGLFPFYIVQGLYGQADNNRNGWISAEELFQYAEKRTIYQSYICAFLLGIPLDGQHPQIDDGWPSTQQHNDGELEFIQIS